MRGEVKIETENNKKIEQKEKEQTECFADRFRLLRRQKCYPARPVWAPLHKQNEHTNNSTNTKNNQAKEAKEEGELSLHKAICAMAKAASSLETTQSVS